MIIQLDHHVVECPICGRPVEIQSEHVDRELACGHCRGHFVVHDTNEGELIAARIGGMDVLERAERMLQRSGRPMDYLSTTRPNQLLQLLSVRDDDDHLRNARDTSPARDEQTVPDQPIAFLVEHRDEVFARVATDMAEAGMRVIRAKSVTEALRLCGTYAPGLVVANLDLPDQSGWLLASKLRFVDRGIRVWLYQPKSSSYDKSMVNYLQVDELLDHGGDLLDLSEAIIGLLANRHELSSVSKDAREVAAT